MTENQILLSPDSLYPTESLISIQDEQIQFYVRAFADNKDNVALPLVFIFDNNYYILKGHHIVLAAAISEIDRLLVEIVDRFQLSFWKNDENVVETLNSIGISTLYDFEAIGGFTYKSYPVYYRKEEK